MAPYEEDGNCYAATIESIDTDKDTCLVAFTGYEECKETVPMKQLVVNENIDKNEKFGAQNDEMKEEITKLKEKTELIEKVLPMIHELTQSIGKFLVENNGPKIEHYKTKKSMDELKRFVRTKMANVEKNCNFKAEKRIAEIQSNYNEEFREICELQKENQELQTKYRQINCQNLELKQEADRKAEEQLKDTLVELTTRIIILETTVMKIKEFNERKYDQKITISKENQEDKHSEGSYNGQN